MPRRSRTLAQRVSIGLGVFFLVNGIIGLIINPDFGTGSELSSKQFLVDWNGWHAVSALALAPIALAAAAHRRSAMVFLAGNTIGNVAESVWSVIDRTPLGLLYFPNVATDVALHLSVAGVSLAAFLAQLARHRGPAPHPIGA
ncbi:MAG TPA: DUF4383 domain-containing protein [Mycobacteriales bacterium]|nr:DUF4383 domain-containing protein [Mycobacteriales bacterium]